MKLIVMLRNPIDRAFSHWNMVRHKNNETLDFLEAIRREPERCRESLPFQHRRYTYVDRGHYLAQLRRLWMFFPREQVLILKSEDFRAHPEQVLKRTCQFLGVDTEREFALREVSPSNYGATMSTEARDYLRQIYAHEIRAVERELDWDCSDWLAD